MDDALDGLVWSCLTLGDIIAEIEYNMIDPALCSVECAPRICGQDRPVAIMAVRECWVSDGNSYIPQG